MKPTHFTRGKAAFTLIELLTVIAIIGVLAGIIVAITGRASTSAQDVACTSNLRQIGLAVQLYGGEHKIYPPALGGGTYEPSGYLWYRTLRPYMEGQKPEEESKVYNSPVIVCPGRTITSVPSDGTLSSYAAHPLLFFDETNPNRVPRRMGSLERPAEIIMMADATQRASGEAYGNFFSVSECYAPTTNPAYGHMPVGVGPDKDGDYSWFRYRHNGHMNVAFADGHVGFFQKGEVLRRNVQVNY
ncbi:MAG: DUF1559 domain-containing protein [Verrucomicrobiota bacterium JB024]|nr:DUF1559 domain-containing protein [Verrucomicrobiota bacterium JB024]